MLTQENSDLLTLTGPERPCGVLLRKYWQPIALSQEVSAGGPPLPLTIFGEELVLFRDPEGRPGLLDAHCCHRGADLSYGRCENGGLRCLYHGWLYDVEGNCLETPGEPPDSKFCESIRQPAYPCHEAVGAIFAYVGSDEAPLFPKFDFLTAAENHVHMNKIYQNCNFLQGNEGNIDPVHTHFLHRPLQDVNAPSTTGSDLNVFSLFAEKITQKIDIEETAFGVRIFAVRELPDDKKYLRVTNYVFPNLCAIAGSESRQDPNGSYSVHWHVPIDDTHHWRFEFNYQRNKPIDPEFYRDLLGEEMTEDWHLKRNNENRYLQDREAMTNVNFTGMGKFFPAHDAYATESQGAIQNRQKEHLGSSDIAIAAARRMMLKAIEDVKNDVEPPNIVRTESENNFESLVVISEVVDDDVDVNEFCNQKAEFYAKSDVLDENKAS